MWTELLEAKNRFIAEMWRELFDAEGVATQIVIVGDRYAEDCDALWRAANRPYRPFAHIFPVPPGDDQRRVTAILPWIENMRMVDGRASAYVCRNFTCDAPTTDPARLS